MGLQKRSFLSLCVCVLSLFPPLFRFFFRCLHLSLHPSYHLSPSLSVLFLFLFSPPPLALSFSLSHSVSLSLSLFLSFSLYSFSLSLYIYLSRLFSPCLSLFKTVEMFNMLILLGHVQRSAQGKCSICSICSILTGHFHVQSLSKVFPQN